MKRTGNTMIAALLVATPVVAAALFYVWAQVTTVILGYRLSEAARELQEEREVNRGLQLEAASLRSPERLEQMGVQFGLMPPTQDQVLKAEDRP